MHKRQNGYIVVETIGSFLLFVLLITSILSLVNIVALQARVHYAITQAAQTLSMYSYVLDVTGMAGHIKNLNAQAQRAQDKALATKENVLNVVDAVQSLSSGDGSFSDIKDIQTSGGALVDTAKEIAADPKGTLALVLNYGLSQAGSLGFELAARAMTGAYLANGDQAADAYLKSAGVIDGLEGLNFSDIGGTNNSQLIDANGDVKLVVSYKVSYVFGGLPLPESISPSLSITQEVRTRAWLSGSAGA